MTAIEQVISGRPRDLGGFSVRRSLPHARRRMIGPFVFLDEFGPVDFKPGDGVDVRPHPHIGLATVTYLFEGRMLHQDSLGIVQEITPGALNWMTAGRGVTHSERSPEDARRNGQRMHGMQAWVALPLEKEDTEPTFEHVPADKLPKIKRDGAALTLIAGEAYGESSPASVASPLFYVAAALDGGAALDMTSEHVERGVYAVDDGVSINGEPLEAGGLAVLNEGAAATVAASSDARVMLLGGSPLEGERHIYWNFVASSQERIEAAKRDWIASQAAEWSGSRFILPPHDDQEFIPLPEQ